MNEERTCERYSSEGIILLNCGYADSKEVKRLGTYWHTDWQMWFIQSWEDQSEFKRWLFNNGK
tara:strand:+ start:1774 stop:1962 length:189 start_codon:yes stop_codon:yes gene_type:complete